MTFDEYVDQEFQKNLELAREELMLEEEDTHGEMEYSERRTWSVAIEWTQEDVANYVGTYLEEKWWEKQEGINKAFYQ
jgi:hypothetical protein